MMRWGDVVQGGGVVLAVGGRRGFWGGDDLWATRIWQDDDLTQCSMKTTRHGSCWPQFLQS